MQIFSERSWKKTTERERARDLSRTFFLRTSLQAFIEVGSKSYPLNGFMHGPSARIFDLCLLISKFIDLL